MRAWTPVLAILLLAFGAAGDHLYVADQVLRNPIEGAILRALPDGSTVVVSRDPIADTRLRELHPPAGQAAFLAELHADGVSLELLQLAFPVLWSGGDFVIFADDEGAERSDGLPMCKERLLYADLVDLPEFNYSKKAADPALLSSLASSVSATKFNQTVGELSGHYVFWLNGQLKATDNRYTHGAEHLIAADYIDDRVSDYGYTVTRQYFNVGASTTQNVIAVKTGTTYPDEIVVVGAHFDAISELVSTSSPNGKAPGAEDNATGTAAVMQLAELFAELETERTIHFIAFSGEEQGLYGSQYYVQQAGLNGDDVVAALIMDMISYWGSNYRVIIEGETEWEPLMQVFESAVQGYTALGYRKDYFSFGSDHVPFQNAGIPSFLAIEWDYGSYPSYHRSTDTLEKIDSNLGVEIMKAMAVTLANVAGASAPATSTPTHPGATQLAQNQPNPFNPSTTISFDLAHDGAIELSIFDLGGRRVRTLARERRAAGTHELSWDGRDDAGHVLASGSYFYRLHTEQGEWTRRMVLLK